MLPEMIVPRPPRRLALVCALLAAALPSACSPPSGASATSAGARSGAEPRGLVILPPEHPVLDPDLPPRDYYHDFGRVATGQVLEHPFFLRNVEDVPITIQRVNPSCGCTVPSLSCTLPSGEVIEGKAIVPGAEDVLVVPPNAVARLSVRIDTNLVKRKNTDQLLGITIQTDNEESFFLQVEVHLFVEQPFNMVPNGIDLKRIPWSVGGTGSMEIAPVTGYSYRIVGLGPLPADVHAELSEREVFGTVVYDLVAGLDPPLERGWAARTLELEIEDGEGQPQPPLEVGLVALVTDELDVDPVRFVLVEKRQASHAVTVRSLVPGHAFEILDAQFDADDRGLFDVAVQPVGASDGPAFAWTVTLSLREPYPSEQRTGTLKLSLAGAEVPELEIPFVFHPR